MTKEESLFWESAFHPPTTFEQGLKSCLIDPQEIPIPK